MLVWSGDYQSRLQFSGPLNQEISGQDLSENSQQKSNCEVFAKFNEVLKKDKSSLAKFLKIQFKFVCVEDGQKKVTYELAEELIKLPELKTTSSSIYISKKLQKNQLRVEDYSLQVSKSSSKK